MPEKCLLRCHARPGVFDGEKMVRITVVDAAGKEHEAVCLAYDASIELEGVPDESGEQGGKLQAYRLGEEAEKGLVDVVLPQATFQNGPNVTVRKRDVL